MPYVFFVRSIPSTLTLFQMSKFVLDATETNHFLWNRQDRKKKKKVFEKLAFCDRCSNIHENPYSIEWWKGRDALYDHTIWGKYNYTRDFTRKISATRRNFFHTSQELTVVSAHQTWWKISHDRVEIWLGFWYSSTIYKYWVKLNSLENLEFF